MDYIITSDGELYHYGVKGMKWGVHRFRDKSGSESSGPKKKHATDATSNAMRVNRAVSAGRAISEAAKGNTAGAMYYARQSNKYNKAVKERNSPDDAPTKTKTTDKTKSKTSKGAKAAAEAVGRIGTAYLADQIFWGGRGTRAAKNAVKAAGILTISAIAKARGAEDIHWYDKYGRRIV